MCSVIRATCSHCGREIKQRTDERALSDEVAALTGARCPECGEIGIVIAIADEPPERTNSAVRLSQIGDRA